MSILSYDQSWACKNNPMKGIPHAWVFVHEALRNRTSKSLAEQKSWHQLCNFWEPSQHNWIILLKSFATLMLFWSAILCADAPIDERSFADLPKDIILNIRDRLDLDELVALRRTCKPMTALIDQRLIVQHARKQIQAYMSLNNDYISEDCEKLLACCGFTDVPRGMDFKAWLHIYIIKERVVNIPPSLAVQDFGNSILRRIWFHTFVVPLWPSKHLFHRYLAQFEAELERNKESAAEMYSKAGRIYKENGRSSVDQFVKPALMREQEGKIAAVAQQNINTWFS